MRRDRHRTFAAVALRGVGGDPHKVPRPPRVEFAGAIYHVTTRGTRRLPVLCCDADRRKWLEIVGDVVTRFSWVCHAYCLMPNHYHLLITTPEPNLSAGMQRLNWYLARTFNSRHEHRGHAFDARYGAVLVEREAHLLELCRYVVLNPVRAGLVPEPGAWPWSSYAATCGDAEPPEFLNVDWILACFDADQTRARAAYRAFVQDGLSKLAPRSAWHVPGTAHRSVTRAARATH